MLFIEVGGFSARLANYLDDDGYRALQNALIANPKAGDVIAETHGVRKLRWNDRRRGKGKRGGLRVIYYYHDIRGHVWMMGIYDKDEASDLTQAQRRTLGELVLALQEEA